MSTIDPLDEVVYSPPEHYGDELTRRDVLVSVCEECAEVIQAATKCLRFGWDRNWPNYGVNHEKLANEWGELFHTITLLGMKMSAMTAAKPLRIAKYKKYMRTHPVSK